MQKIFISISWIILILSGVFAQESKKLNLIATDKSNNSIGDLKKEEITLLIDGKPQVIDSFEKQESPLIYAFAIDSSASMRFIINDVRSSAKAVVNQNRIDDETMLISFVGSDKIRAMQNFSSDKNFLVKAMDSLSVEGGQTALIDALYLAIKQVAEHKKDKGEEFRRVVVAITDGEDRDSYYTEKTILELIQKEKVQIFFIGLVNELSQESGFSVKSPKAKAENFIRKIAKESGGMVLSPKKLEDLAKITAQLMPLMQSQYLINYTPLIEVKSKSQKVEVKLAKDSKRKDVNFIFVRVTN